MSNSVTVPSSATRRSFIILPFMPCGQIEHHDGPPPSVSVWFRYLAPILGRSTRDDYMRVAPWFELQLVETLKS